MKDSRQLDGGTAKKFRHRVPQWREKLGVIVCLLLLPFVAGAQSKTVTLQVKEMGVEEIILELRQTSGYRFLFNHEEVKDLGAKSIDMQNAPIEDVMEAVLEGTGMTFRIENDVIVTDRDSQGSARARASPRRARATAPGRDGGVEGDNFRDSHER